MEVGFAQKVLPVIEILKTSLRLGRVVYSRSFFSSNNLAIQKCGGKPPFPT
jgi:hypothetical protein